MMSSNKATEQGLIQLIYVSALRPGCEDQLGPILESAQRHNGVNGVTGMLLYSGGNFMQVLEGPDAAVQEAYDRIAQDPRHDHIELISRVQVNQREFADWRMGFRQLSEQDQARFPEHASWFRYGFDPEAIRARPGVALELLQLFAAGTL